MALGRLIGALVPITGAVAKYIKDKNTSNSKSNSSNDRNSYNTKSSPSNKSSSSARTYDPYNVSVQMIDPNTGRKSSVNAQFADKYLKKGYTLAPGSRSIEEAMQAIPIQQRIAINNQLASGGGYGGRYGGGGGYSDDDVFKMIMAMMPKYNLPETLSHDKAKGIAQEQLNPVFEQGLKDALEQVGRNALRSGFFGQLPNVDTEGKIAGDLQLQKASAIAELANQLVGQSEDSAYRQAGFARQQQMDSLNTLLQALTTSGDLRNMDFNNQLALARLLGDRSDSDWNKQFAERQYGDNRSDIGWEKSFKERQYSDSRDDVAWNKRITEAQLTGVFNNKPTMALTELTHRMGMDNRKMEMAEKELNHNITMSWEKLKNDRTALNQAAQRIGLQARGQNLSEKQFMVGVKTKAFDMAMEELAKTGKAEYDPFSNSFGVDSNKITEGEILELMDSYTKILLGIDKGHGKYYKD